MISYDAGSVGQVLRLPSLSERMNAHDKEKRKERQAKGLCRCGKPAANGLKMCKNCLAESREKSRNAYRAKVGIPLGAAILRRGPVPVPVPKLSKRKCGVRITKGVNRLENRDGHGRLETWYVASITVNGKTQCRKWSVGKHGEDGARIAASLQRLLWVIENGQWNPDNGDPLAIAGYAESFNGNRDYDDCVISDISSPWIHRTENEY